VVLGHAHFRKCGGEKQKTLAVGRIIGHSDASSRQGLGNAQDATECALLWKREDIIL
jgi:hypothetical protein